MDKDINRIKAMLAEKKRTNKWLAEQLGCAPKLYQSGVLMIASLQWKHISRWPDYLMLA